MRNSTFRRLLARGSALLLMFSSVLTGCSDDYDDSKLWKNIDDLKERIEALETTVGRMNTEIGALRKIVDEAVTVVKVEKTFDGYTIYFSDNTTAAIADGKNGTDGKPGAAGKDAPVIGVKQNTDGIYYWTITTGGVTEWLTAGGAKLRVTGESITPTIAVDAEGYWTISFDGGTTSERILDNAGNPVSAVSQEGGIGSLFNSVTEDGNNVYFELSDGTIITVPIRSDFYMLIRKAPEVSTFVYGETQVYEVEAVGVQKTVLNKPDEWKVTYAENKLTITAPTQAHKDCADLEGTVSIIYFSANGQSDVVSMDVAAVADERGETVGDNFTVNITDITDKGVTAEVTAKDGTIFWYANAYDRTKYDTNGEAAYLAEQMGMFQYYVSNEYMWGYLDLMLHQGTAVYANTSLKPESELYLAVFGLKVDKSAGTAEAVTGVMTVPFRTKKAVVINTVYRINVSDIGWYTARYVSVPSDDLGFFHGIVRKSEYESYASDDEFMAGYIKKYKDFYNNELYMDRTVTWDMLTSTGTQTVVAPSYHPNEQLTGIAEDMDYYTKPLVPNTDYYVVSFSCQDGDAGSPLSKAAFRTPAFKPSESCTFTVEASVERQDITVKVTPSVKNTTYVCMIARTAYYNGFESDLQYAADDVFWTKIAAEENGKPFSDYLFAGDQTLLSKDNWAATGYEICIYGCTADGVITTEPVLTHIATKGTVDTGAPAAPGTRKQARVSHFER